MQNVQHTAIRFRPENLQKIYNKKKCSMFNYVVIFTRAWFEF